MENKPFRRTLALLAVLFSAVLMSQSALALGDFGGSSLSPADVGVGVASAYGASLDPSSPSNAMIQNQLGMLSGQLGIAQGRLAHDRSMIGMGGYAGNPSYAGFVGAIQGQQNFLQQVLGVRSQIAALGPNYYGTFQAGDYIHDAFGDFPGEDVLGYFTPQGGYGTTANMRQLFRVSNSLANISANVSASFMFPPFGAARVAGAPFLSAQGVVFSGHGGYFAADGLMQIPMGTRFTIWAAPGARISHAFGNALETGGNLLPFMDEAMGARSFLPGANIPNLTLGPINPMYVMGSPLTVGSNTTLQFLLQPNMGVVNWAACLRGMPPF